MNLTSLLNDATCHIVLVVMDGLGGFADAQFDSELEQATTPNLDQLAAEGIVGLTLPTGAGITAGSGPGHLALGSDRLSTSWDAVCCRPPRPGRAAR